MRLREKVGFGMLYLAGDGEPQSPWDHPEL